MFRLSQTGITKQLEIFLLLFILVPVLCLGIFFLFQMRGNERDTLSFLAYSLTVNKGRISEILGDYETELKELSGNTAVQTAFLAYADSTKDDVWQARMESELERLGVFDGSFEHLAFVDAKTWESVYSSGDFFLSSEEADFIKTFSLTETQQTLGVLFREAGTPDVSALFFLPFSLDQTTGEFEGFLVAQSDLSTLLDLQKSFHTLSDTGEIQLVNWQKGAQAQAVLPSRFTNLSLVSHVSSDSLYAQALKQDRSLETDHVDYRRQQVFSASRYLADYGIGLAVKIDKGEVQKPLILLAGSLAAITILLLFFGFVLIVYFSATVAKPLEDLAQAARRIEKGEENVHLPLTDAKNEIGVMTRAFNRMTKSLVESNEELEGKVRDRTRELRKNFALIQKEKAKDDALLSSIGEGMLVVDEEGVIAKVNRAAEEIFVLPSDRLVGKVFASVVALLDKKGEVILNKEHPVFVALGSAKKVIRAEFSSKRSDGTLFPLALTSAPILLGERVIGSVIIVRDITKEKEIDRMKTEFISIASHQLRGPVASIKWYGELLRKEVARMKPSTREFVDRVNISTAQLIALIDDFLNVSRIEAGTVARKPEDIEPFKLVENIVETYRHDIEGKGLRLHILNRSLVKIVRFDPEAIREIYANLIANAVKYSRDHGDISIRLFDRGMTLMLEVKDSGAGIPKDEQDKIFTKFYRASNVLEGGFKGTGLGLYTAYMLAKQSGGDIKFTSVKGKGSTFTVALPRRQKNLSPK